MKLKVFDLILEIKYTFLILLTLLLYRRASLTLISIFSIFIHEMGHILAMLSNNNKICRLTIDIFGFTIERSASNNDFSQDGMFVSLMGPLANLGLSVFFYFVCINSRSYNNHLYLLYINNFFLFLFNMLPMKGLDGGQLFYNFLLKRTDPGNAGKVLIKVSLLLIILIVLFSLYALIKYHHVLSLISVVLYLVVTIFFKLGKPL